MCNKVPTFCLIILLMICSVGWGSIWTIPKDSEMLQDPLANITGAFHVPSDAQVQPAIYGYMDNDSGNYYFSGDTAKLNRFLLRATKWIQQVPEDGWYSDVSARIVIHAGIAKFENQVPGNGGTPKHVDWKLEVIPSSKLDGATQTIIHKQSVTVHIWIGEQIRLDGLEIPKEFAVESGGEIERFLEKRHRQSRTRAVK